MSFPSTGYNVTFSVYSVTPLHCLSLPGSERCRGRNLSSLLFPRAWHVRQAMDTHGWMEGGPWVECQVYSLLLCAASVLPPYREPWSGYSS